MVGQSPWVPGALFGPFRLKLNIPLEVRFLGSLSPGASSVCLHACVCSWNIMNLLCCKIGCRQYKRLSDALVSTLHASLKAAANRSCLSSSRLWVQAIGVSVSGFLIRPQYWLRILDAWFLLVGRFLIVSFACGVPHRHQPLTSWSSLVQH